MPFDTKLIDDLVRVATGAFGAVAGVREEARTRLREQFEHVLSRLDVVTREEFEIVRALAQRAREEQELLAARVAALEAGGEARGQACRLRGARPRRRRPSPLARPRPPRPPRRPRSLRRRAAGPAPRSRTEFRHKSSTTLS